MTKYTIIFCKGKGPASMKKAQSLGKDTASTLAKAQTLPWHRPEAQLFPRQRLVLLQGTAQAFAKETARPLPRKRPGLCQGRYQAFAKAEARLLPRQMLGLFQGRC
ncbi:hypothetical protein VP01_30g4 [Puccinia sorghi]|uniref:Uncharacterized protein n=1 Tax=Puccinia sorghi TaxID=27349 RepID=A0A0L6UZE3_9BASI|nr:hypothetical protein VP01_30g4 [Puccinia sorghi]